MMVGLRPTPHPLFEKSGAKTVIANVKVFVKLFSKSLWGAGQRPAKSPHLIIIDVPPFI
jgi:hypothetical protein